MANWKKLHDEEGDEIWVNLELAMSVQRDGRLTRIMFPGSEDDVVDVKEPPEEVLGLTAL